jgi:thymidylate synthase
MNKTDKVYIDLLKDIMENGVEKNTRAGDVLSVFGRQLRFDLKEGFPLLTTKKVFMKGIMHELLWFLQRSYNSHSSMNIEYLVRNGVHIWDDDAYRWFKTEIAEGFSKRPLTNEFMVCVSDDEGVNAHKKPTYEVWIENELRHRDTEWLKNITKEEFIDLTLQRVEIHGSFMSVYRFGDLGPVYGKQWRSFGRNHIDQIQNIITTLRRNPNDRRMLCVAFNPDQLDEMALPPCHVMFQFYTRELKREERLNWLSNTTSGDSDEDWFDTSDEKMDRLGVPKYGLSCMWVQRSVDVCCGLPFNIASYALLTCMIAHLVGMIPDELVGSLGDCHIYKNHIDGVNEQLKRAGSDTLPTLKIKRKVESIEDFKYDDFEIVNYNPDPPIKYQLNVG